MSEPEPLAEVRRWLRYAREDLEAAESLLAEETHAPRHPCWLAQQAAEKALKAALVFLEVDFPRRHDLDALRNLLPGDWLVRSQQPDLAELTEWAVEARYPGDWPDASEENAQRAVQQARAVYESVRGDLAQRGVDLHETT
jgi:HEPN domain-containing protein